MPAALGALRPQRHARGPGGDGPAARRLGRPTRSSSQRRARRGDPARRWCSRSPAASATVRGPVRRRAAPPAAARGPRRGLAADALGLLGSMPAFLDAPAALEQLRGVGLRLGVLTQSAPEAADAVLRFAGLRDRHRAGAQRPGVGRLQARSAALPDGRRAHGRPPEEVGLVAAHWWDVAGAKRRRPADRLGRAPRHRAARRGAGARRRRPRPHRGLRGPRRLAEPVGRGWPPDDRGAPGRSRS